MRRLLISLSALTAVLIGSSTAEATAPSPTPTTVVTTRPGTVDTTPTSTDRPSVSTDEEDDWTLQRIIVTGAVAIAGLAFVGWAVARIRNELTKPSGPKT